MLIALSSRESEFQYLYVSSRKQIENVYRCRPDTKLELHKKEPKKLELQKNEPSKLELHKIEPITIKNFMVLGMIEKN